MGDTIMPPYVRACFPRGVIGHQIKKCVCLCFYLNVNCMVLLTKGYLHLCPCMDFLLKFAY